MDERLTVKKGYSIWSLLVIMTLLAVWLAIPRERGDENHAFVDDQLWFLVVHQLLLWAFVASLVCMVTGWKREVILIITLVLIAAWLPAVCIAVESSLLSTLMTVDVLHRIGLLVPYRDFYEFINTSFGYGILFDWIDWYQLSGRPAVFSPWIGRVKTRCDLLFILSR